MDKNLQQKLLGLYINGLLEQGRINSNDQRLTLVNCFLEDIDEIEKGIELPTQSQE